jgi:hypothetical protein
LGRERFGARRVKFKYPAIVEEGESYVEGEIFDILPVFDKYEEFDPKNPAASPYVRKTKKAGLEIKNAFVFSFTYSISDWWIPRHADLPFLASSHAYSARRCIPQQFQLISDDENWILYWKGKYLAPVQVDGGVATARLHLLNVETAPRAEVISDPKSFRQHLHEVLRIFSKTCFWLYLSCSTWRCGPKGG